MFDHKIILKKVNKRVDRLLIIFSKNRALQLQATLHSIALNAQDIFTKIVVVYTTDDALYQVCYEALIKRFPMVEFIKETNFKENILSCLDNMRLVMFLTDDDIIFRELKEIPFRIMSEPSNYDQACFSFRLGTNIDYCYSCQKPNSLKVYSSIEEDDVIMTDWKDEEYDFNYPLSVTSHLFLKMKIKHILEDTPYHSPNSMEANIQRYRDQMPGCMLMNRHSSIVGVPANRVNNDYPNSNGLTYGYTTLELNDKFLEGYYIDIEKMDFSNIHQAQQELQYVFSK